MSEQFFRVHGDNIVECERLISLITNTFIVRDKKYSYSSLACVKVSIILEIKSDEVKWNFELFSGFNKNTSDRWTSNILDILTQLGSFLDETPDIILTRVHDNFEELLLAIEFCSALQAGNQAWQRSGRAFSTGRTEIPYLYIVDFTKYELDTDTRERKALRYPNPAVPFSYISHTINTKNLTSQVYFQAEEFQPDYDTQLQDFDTQIFAEKAVSHYLVNKLSNESTDDIEKDLLRKNLLMVEYLSKTANHKNNFDSHDWEKIYQSKLDIVDYAIEKNKFIFKKKIARQSLLGKVLEFNEIVSKFSVGLASRDLPFGIIPQKNRTEFVNEFTQLYGFSDKEILSNLLKADNLIVCLLKAFKPRGDDNRPDRGALPLIAMLAGERTEILTFIYGPLVESNYESLKTDLLGLAQRNGLWKSIVGLSNFIVVDSPLVNAPTTQVQLIIDNNHNKHQILEQTGVFEKRKISIYPNEYHEHDVDTAIHSLFKYAIPDTFEGMCNPPGGDWSGLSIIFEEIEYRWLSLPRVSSDSKRPDHVIQLFNVGKKPILLSIESKERPEDLENSVGIQLTRYLEFLFQFTPSTDRSRNGSWRISSKKMKIDDFQILSVGAYIVRNQIDSTLMLSNSKCDMLFELVPDVAQNVWKLKIISTNDISAKVATYIKDNIIDNEISSSFQINDAMIKTY